MECRFICEKWKASAFCCLESWFFLIVDEWGYAVLSFRAGLVGIWRQSSSHIYSCWLIDRLSVWIGYKLFHFLAFRLIFRWILPYVMYKIPLPKGSRFWIPVIQVFASLNLLLSIVVGYGTICITLYSLFHFVDSRCNLCHLSVSLYRYLLVSSNSRGKSGALAISGQVSIVLLFLEFRNVLSNRVLKYLLLLFSQIWSSISCFSVGWRSPWIRFAAEQSHNTDLSTILHFCKVSKLIVYGIEDYKAQTFCYTPPFLMFFWVWFLIFRRRLPPIKTHIFLPLILLPWISGAACESETMNFLTLEPLCTKCQPHSLHLTTIFCPRYILYMSYYEFKISFRNFRWESFRNKKFSFCFCSYQCQEASKLQVPHGASVDYSNHDSPYLICCYIDCFYMGCSSYRVQVWWTKGSVEGNNSLSIFHWYIIPLMFFFDEHSIRC